MKSTHYKRQLVPNSPEQSDPPYKVKLKQEQRRMVELTREILRLNAALTPPAPPKPRHHYRPPSKHMVRHVTEAQPDGIITQAYLQATMREFRVTDWDGVTFRYVTMCTPRQYNKIVLAYQLRNTLRWRFVTELSKVRRVEQAIALGNIYMARG